MKKLSTTTLLFMFTAIMAFGQTKTSYHEQNRIYFHRNLFAKTFVKVSKAPTFGNESLALQNYLSDKLKSQISQAIGDMKVGLLIDSAGKPFCEWIENRSNIRIDQYKLNQIVDEMPKWNAGILANHKVNCAQTLLLTFNQQNLFVQCRNRIDGE
jgi:hypothetical protein